MGYGNFYGNVCRLLSSLNSGICHRRPSVKLPLSKVGRELSAALVHLGIIADFSVGQRTTRVKGHSRIWEPPATGLAASADAAGYPAMYITLHLNWDKHKPLYSTAQLAAAPSSTAAGGASSSRRHIATPGFTPPTGLNSPTPESIKIMSKPSAQRWMGVGDLLRARGKAPPGIYLLSTHQGLMTDIDAELRGVGGIVLAHLGLPLGHVVQLRGLLRSKYQAELVAAKQQPQAQLVHVPLSRWDARAFAGQVVSSRLSQQHRHEASQYLDVLDAAETARREASAEAGERLDHLALQELVWTRQAAQQREAGASGEAGSSSSSSSSGGVGGFSRGHRRHGRGVGEARPRSS